MKFLKKIGVADACMLFLCFLIILVAEYLFLTGHERHALFIGLWAPTLLGIMIYIKLIGNGNK